MSSMTSPWQKRISEWSEPCRFNGVSRKAIIMVILTNHYHHNILMYFTSFTLHLNCSLKPLTRGRSPNKWTAKMTILSIVLIIDSIIFHYQWYPTMMNFISIFELFSTVDFFAKHEEIWQVGKCQNQVTWSLSNELLFLNLFEFENEYVFRSLT